LFVGQYFNSKTNNMGRKKQVAVDDWEICRQQKMRVAIFVRAFRDALTAKK
jgi:hypothetical protein